MYSDKKNILQLVALLRAHGVTKVVLCPGSRNAPIVHTLAGHPDFTCYSVTDERSAGFFAIGLALQGGTPAAVCCTSGTALLNLHPAITLHIFCFSFPKSSYYFSMISIFPIFLYASVPMYRLMGKICIIVHS